MTPPETLYLIDGYAAIFRAFYAIRNPLYSPVTGEPTQAVLVFAQMLLKLYAQMRPHYVAVALDAPGRTFRDDLYVQYTPVPLVIPSALDGIEPAAPVGGETTGDVLPAEDNVPRYKGTRRATPDSLHLQLGRILELLDLLEVPVISRPGLEADDVIATLTDRVLADEAYPDLRVRIVSRDKDLEQLLSRRATLFDVHTEAETDVAALWERRGVTPAQVVDLLTLTGDVVDNIPGVAGIGPKTAAKLLQQFGSLEGILANLDQVPQRWRESLEKARTFLPLSRRLVTLERDPEIAFSLPSARARPLPAEKLLPFFEELGFSRLKVMLTVPAASTPPG